MVNIAMEVTAGLGKIQGNTAAKRSASEMITTRALLKPRVLKGSINSLMAEFLPAIADVLTEPSRLSGQIGRWDEQ